MKQPLAFFLVGAFILTLGAAEFDRFCEIYPIPRHALYGDAAIPTVGFSLKPGMKFNREKIAMFAKDLSGYLQRQWGKPFTLAIDASQGIALHLLTPEERSEELKKRIPDSEIAKLPPGERGKQSFLIRSLSDAVYIVSPSEQGAVYALAGLIQLLRPTENGWSFRPVHATDFPGFEMRMGSAAQVGGKNAPVQRQEESLLLTGLLFRYNYGKAGYPGDTSCHQYALDHFLKLTSGYWNRPKAAAPLAAWNWSAPAVNREYVNLALRYAAEPGVGAYFWHDVTDAGWWHIYIEQFWNKRDELDRKNYPADPSPAKPDALRFRQMFEALERERPDLDVIWTVPVYYDLPGKDDLKDVKNFRAYLQTVAATVPESMRERFYVMLEERAPEVVADYRKYMDNLKMCQYRYTSVWSGTTWDLNFTEAKKHDGKTEGYFYEAPDLLAAMAAQYLWNPQLPTDEAWIVENIAPRAAFLLYGAAWQEMLAFIRLNLNIKTIVKENNSKLLNARKADAARGLALLKTAANKLSTANTYAHWLISVQHTKTEEYLKIVNAALENAARVIPLGDAKFSCDAGNAVQLKRAALSDGKIAWSSGSTPAPHWVEMELPATYSINRILLKAPGDGGYSWRDAEIQAQIFGNWRKLAPLTGEKQLPADFDDVRTNRIRLLFRQGWDWGKVERPDMILSGISLYGTKVQPDPPGTARLDGIWKFRLDPRRSGINAKWFEHKDFPKNEWYPIPVPSHFEQSGIPGTANYDGQVWYATTFETPAGWQGKAVKLHFGAVDDEAEVWLNGQHLGLHTKKGETDATWWEEPFRFDVTSVLKPEGERNTLVVRVDDFTLDGGIWKPVLLHIGDGPGLYSGK